MFLIRVSSSRLFIINEYWLIVPPILILDYILIRKIIRLKKAKNKNNYQTKSKHLKIFHLAINNIVEVLRIRGGQELIELSFNYPACEIGKGFRYLENERLRNIIAKLFELKTKDDVIFITQTALCHLIKSYGFSLLLPSFVPLEDVVILTNWYQFIRKTCVVLLLGGAFPVGVLGIYAETAVSLYILSVTLGGAGIALALTNRDFPFVQTTLISGAVKSIESIKRRVPIGTEVVSVDFENVDFENQPRNQIQMSKNKPECLLADQRFTNRNCRIKPSEIVENSNNIVLDYKDVVNLHDVTGLDTVEFTDKYTFSDKHQLPSSTKTVRPKPRLRGTTVKFLDKFGDPQNVSENETWETATNSFKRIGKKNPNKTK